MRSSLTILVLFLTAGSLGAEEAFVLQQAETQDSAGRFATLEDSTGKLTIAEAAARTDWKTSVSNTANFGYTLSAYWVRIPIQNTATDPAEVFLEIAYPLLDNIQLFSPGPTGFVERSTGDTIPFRMRDVQYRNFVFRLTVPPSSTRIFYARVQTEGTMKIPVTIHTPIAFAEKSTRELFVFGLYYGILLVMALYNFFIYLSTRDSSYLFYVMFITGFSGFAMAYTGIGFQWLWPEYPYLGNRAVPIFTGFSLAAVSLFAYTFLRLALHLPIVGRIFLVIAAAGALICAASFRAPYQQAMIPGVLLTMITSVLLLIAGTLVFLRGERAARFFLTAWFVLLLGFVALALVAFGKIPSNFFTEYAIQIGSAAEVILLALALADRINISETEKKAAQDRTIAVLRANDSLKDELLSNISHEINTPISNLVMQAEMLRDGDVRQADLPETYETLHRSAVRLESVARTLVMSAKLDSGNMKAEQNPVAVAGLLEEVGASIHVDHPERRLVVRASDGAVTTDRPLLRAVLQELLRNACLYSPPNREVLISSENRPGFVEFSIRDFGPGIPEDQLSKVRGKFYRIDGSLTYAKPGMGLGLYICDRAADLLGADLKLANHPEGGLVAVLTIPAA